MRDESLYGDFLKKLKPGNPVRVARVTVSGILPGKVSTVEEKAIVVEICYPDGEIIEHAFGRVSGFCKKIGAWLSSS